MNRRVEIFPIIILFCGAMLFTSTNCSKSTEPEDQPDTLVTILKPNIYIYPNVTQQLNVSLSFPQGGYVTISEPKYQNGWNVSVDTEGLIDNKYDFLFYECKAHDSWQYKYGWIVNKHKIEGFFRSNLESYGFHGREIEDFIDYWLPIFIDYDEMIVYPQVDSEIEEIITLDISNPPDNIRRLFYIVSENSPSIEIPQTPIVNSINREGFTVMEWGVILK